MKRLKSILSLLLIFAISWGYQPATIAAVLDTGFSDVSADAWYAEAANYCVEKGLVGGTSAYTFSPDDPMSRAMLATALFRMAGSPQVAGSSGFSDVAPGTWYTDAVTWAVQNQIVTGYSSGLFGTNDPVTHEQILTTLWRHSGSPDMGGIASSFSDASAISAYAVSAVNWAKSIGVIGGKTGILFSPKENATRASVATILRNYLSLEHSAARPTPIFEPTFTPPLTPELEPMPTPEPTPTSVASMTSINITVGDTIFSAKLYNNSTARSFLGQLPMTLNMSELNGNEKFYYLPTKLPADSGQVGSIKNGDLMLYGSDCLVLFYKGFPTSYSYTRLGYIDDPSGLTAALGSGSVEVSFAIGD